MKRFFELLITIMLFVPNMFYAQNQQLKGACPSTITDNDGNTYNTIQIGIQCWMKENIRTTHDENGNQIALGPSENLSPRQIISGKSANSSVPYYYYPNNDKNPLVSLNKC